MSTRRRYMEILTALIPLAVLLALWGFSYKKFSSKMEYFSVMVAMLRQKAKDASSADVLLRLSSALIAIQHYKDAYNIYSRLLKEGYSGVQMDKVRQNIRFCMNPVKGVNAPKNFIHCYRHHLVLVVLGKQRHDFLTEKDHAKTCAVLKSSTALGANYLKEAVHHLGHLFTPGTPVDLGLSVMWANCNVGAVLPEDYGGYYSWGETEEKVDYTWKKYKYVGKDLGPSISGTSYDVAHVRWGDSWRMPTMEEMDELCENCTWKWMVRNGVNGQRITGPNGNSIFLPAAGYRGTYMSSLGTYGNYWSGTPAGSNNAYDLRFHDKEWDYWDSEWCRNYGLPVRPVME